jgi:hypothetical protein
MAIIGLALLYVSCDTLDDVKPAQGKTFIKLFGGSGTEVGKDIALMPDGGFVLVGSTTSNSIGGRDVYVVRTDNIGNMIWEYHAGGVGDDIGNSVILDDGGNILVCGERTQDVGPNPSFRDTYVIRLSVEGSLLSEHTYGDSLRDEYGTDIFDIPDAGFLITSTWLTNDTSTYFIAETDNQLIVLDKRSRYINPSAGGNNYSARAFNRTDPIVSEPPYIATGSGQDIIGSGGSALKVFKFQASYFNTIQDDTPPVLYGADNANSFCTDIEVTADGGYILCGYTDDGTLVREMIVKVNKGRFLEEAWNYDFINEFNRNLKVPNPEIEADNVISTPGICQTNDGGFIVISTLELDDPLNDEISLLKLNFQGEEEWRKTFGSNDDDMGAEVIQLEDGSYLVVGTVGFEINPDSGSKMCLIKLNPNGDLVPLE